jgi:hypothetical protein
MLARWRSLAFGGNAKKKLLSGINKGATGKPVGFPQHLGEIYEEQA